MKTNVTTLAMLCALLSGCSVGAPTTATTFGTMGLPPVGTTTNEPDPTTTVDDASGSGSGDSRGDDPDTGSTESSDGSAGSTTTGPPPMCGDGVINAPEECDDAGESATCDADCTLAMCGDGVVNATATEECDDGVESATCDIDCTLAMCGDGVVNVAAAEECDDQNAVEDDGCKNDCTFFVSATCNDLLTNASVWGLASTGVDLVPWTSSQLHWIGCPGNGCIPDSFYCTYDAATQQLDFGTTSATAMRSLVDPGNALGDLYPNSFDNNCCSSPGGLCNAPDSVNNGVPVNMVAALCTALGYSSGVVVREVFINFCPEPHAVDVDGQQWDSDFIDSDGFGAEYRCNGFL